MKDSSFESARQIAARVLETPERERTARAIELCGGNATLLARVNDLLRSHDAATIVGEGPLTPVADSPTAHTTEAPPPPPPASLREPRDRTLATRPDHGRQPLWSSSSGPSSPARQRFGSYTILETLGEGGMGVVYLAEQQRPKRVVALKVIRPGFFGPKTLRRFELEAQTLARLQHPGIAQIYEAGFAAHEDGSSQPFFAMEFIRGVTLTEFAASRSLNTAQRLRLFMRVCEAVQHAHQKGVIHRDLKPGNILVESSGAVKVLDFGVARNMDGDDAAQAVAHRTEAGQLVGTVPYMSPEQIGGDAQGLDTRSDVYTLGVILYELLTGRVPHNVSGKTIIEAARQKSEGSITPIGQLNKAYRGELQTIVSKALERDRERRYQSASDLAADLERFLTHQPILARPPSRAYLARKFAQRNRAAVVVAAAASVLVCAGVGGTIWQAVRATRGWSVAREETANAQAANEFLSTMLASADPDNAVGRLVTVRDVADEASRGVGEELSDRPVVEWSVRKTLAMTYRGLDMLEEATRHARRCVELANAQFGADDLRTIESSRVLATVLTNAGAYDEAEALARANLERMRRVYGDLHPDTSLTVGELGRIMQETGRFGEGEARIREALQLAERTREKTDPELLSVRHNLATVMKDQGKLEEAEAAMREIVELRTQRHGREHPQTAFSLNNLAAVLQKREKFDEALTLLREVLEMRERMLGPEHQSTVTSRMNLAVVLISQKKLDEGEPLIRSALESYRRTLGPDHAKTLIGMGNLAYVLEDRGKLVEAEALYREIVDIRRRATGGKDPETWSPMNNLAMLLQQQGKLEEARTLFVELIGLCEATLPADHYYTAIFRNNYGDLLTDMGRYDEARTALESSLGVLRVKLGTEHARVKKGEARLQKLKDKSHASEPSSG